MRGLALGVVGVTPCPAQAAAAAALLLGWTQGQSVCGLVLGVGDATLCPARGCHFGVVMA